MKRVLAEVAAGVRERTAARVTEQEGSSPTKNCSGSAPEFHGRSGWPIMGPEKRLAAGTKEGSPESEAVMGAKKIRRGHTSAFGEKVPWGGRRGTAIS